MGPKMQADCSQGSFAVEPAEKKEVSVHKILVIKDNLSSYFIFIFKKQIWK